MPPESTIELESVFCEVLETLAFMFGDAVDKDEIPTSVEDVLEATITFTGAKQGKLSLVASRGIAMELAANALGVDVDDDEADEGAQDALGELMNVTLGQLLTAIEGNTEVFDLNPPNVTAQPDSATWEQYLDDPQSVAFVVDDHPVIIRFETEE